MSDRAKLIDDAARTQAASLEYTARHAHSITANGGDVTAQLTEDPADVVFFLYGIVLQDGGARLAEWIAAHALAQADRCEWDYRVWKYTPDWKCRTHGGYFSGDGPRPERCSGAKP